MLYILLPAYNEGRSIPSLLPRFKKVLDDLAEDYLIVVVDDGSTDNTAEIASGFRPSLSLELVSHPRNLGLGAAMRTGFEYISVRADDNDMILAMDADDTHDPQILWRMIEKMKAGCDIVIASRYEQGGKEVGLALHRKILSLGASFLLKLFFPIQGAQDYTCGFRLYRGGIIKKAVKGYSKNFIKTNSFVCMAEILIKLSYLEAKVCEVPLVLRYDLKKGGSKMKKLQTIMRYLQLIIREKTNPTRPQI